MVKKKAKLSANLTPAEMRVLIAQDVIDRVNAGRIRPVIGYYLRKHTTVDSLLEARTCQVCAMGAMFVAHIARFDAVDDLQVAAVERGGGSTICDTLGGYFSVTQLRMIEAAFELRSYWLGNDDTIRCCEFGRQFKNKRDRLVAILQNVIDHGGKFKPEVEYEMVDQ